MSPNVPLPSSNPNRHTPGPLVWAGTEAEPAAYVSLHGSTLDGNETRHVLTCSMEPTAADANLIAAAYTAFDKAARSLGVEAQDMAERLNLAALIRGVQEVLDAAAVPHGPARITRLESAIADLATVLPLRRQTKSVSGN